MRDRFNDARDPGFCAAVAGVLGFRRGWARESGGRVFFGRPWLAQKRANCTFNMHVLYFKNQSKSPFRFQEFFNAQSLVETMCLQAFNKRSNSPLVTQYVQRKTRIRAAMVNA
jgi:hypothetical protein